MYTPSIIRILIYCYSLKILSPSSLTQNNDFNTITIVKAPNDL